MRVIAQYIKDLSFENPNVRKLLDSQGEPPNLRVEVNVNASKIADKAYESAIQLKAEATNNLGTIYDLELSYAGMFQIDNMPEAVAGAVPAHQLPGTAVSLRAPAGGRPHARRRLPAAAARPDRFRRAVRQAAAGKAGASSAEADELSPLPRTRFRRRYLPRFVVSHSASTCPTAASRMRATVTAIPTVTHAPNRRQCRARLSPTHWRP